MEGIEIIEKKQDEYERFMEGELNPQDYGE